MQELVENVKPLRNCTPKQVPETKSSPKCSDSINDLKGLSTPSLNDPDLTLKTQIQLAHLAVMQELVHPTKPLRN